jgi:hypothetical protein
MIAFYGNLQHTRCWLIGICSVWLVLEYITNPLLVLLYGFAQYETERLQHYFMQTLRSDVASAIHKEYIYKVPFTLLTVCFKAISPIDFATQALAIH